MRPGEIVVNAGFANFGEPALYKFPQNPAVACLLLVDRRGPGEDPEDGRPAAGIVTIRVRKSEIAAPNAGGIFTLGAETFTVVNRPTIDDPSGYVWKMWAS